MPSDQGDWTALLSAAGIVAARLTPTEAQWMPPSAFDARAAWLGSFAEQPDLKLRAEAAAWRGKPVYFDIIGPWITPERGTAGGSVNRYSLIFFLVVALAVVFLGGLLAWRNLRRGRGDRKGAFRLTAFTLVGYLFAGLIGSFVYTVQPQELGIREALGSTFAIWVLYLALEPYVRRRWPVTLISWNRVLAGQWRDPVVGRDVLIGLMAGIGVVLIGALGQHFIPDLSAFSVSPNPLLRTLSGARLAVSLFVFLVSGAPSFALALLFILFVLRLLARRDSLAVGLFMLVNALPPLLTGDWKSAIGVSLAIGLLAAALTRYGLVALASAYFVINALLNFPVTLNFSAWYIGTALLSLLAILALAMFSFDTSLGGQPVLGEKLLEE
jgi:serine/threonine-protein kinase